MITFIAESGFFVLWVLCGVGVAYIAKKRGKVWVVWLMYGLVLGPIALLLTVFSYGGKMCPYCKSNIQKDAEICPKCDKSFAE